MRINPIAKEVQDTFDGIYAQTVSFVQNPNSAINGLIVSGDAGTGKTYTIKRALKDTNHQHNVEYIKGGKITAASLYVKLYLNRAKHRIVVLDDCDIIHHSEKKQIIPMLLGAAELGHNREVSWETARKNPLMEEFDVPHKFQFEGNLIWITNDRKEDITLIASAILERLGAKFSLEDLRCLETFHWPGNVRQLRNLLIRATVMGKMRVQEPLLKQLLVEEHQERLVISAPADRDALLEGSLEAIEREVIVERLKKHHGNRKETAKDLGIAKSTLHEKLRRWKKDPSVQKNWPVARWTTPLSLH